MPRKQAAMRKIVDGQHARYRSAAPGQVGGRQRRGPVIEMQQVRYPIWITCAGRDLCSGKTEPGKTKIIVRPVNARCVSIGTAVALEKLRTEQHIDGKMVVRGAARKIAGRDAAAGRQMTDDFDCPKLAHDIAIPWEQDAHIALISERAGQRGGYFAKAAHFYVVGKFGGDEQNFRATAWNLVGAERSPTSGFDRPLMPSRIMRS